MATQFIKSPVGIDHFGNAFLDFATHCLPGNAAVYSGLCNKPFVVDQIASPKQWLRQTDGEPGIPLINGRNKPTVAIERPYFLGQIEFSSTTAIFLDPGTRQRGSFNQPWWASGSQFVTNRLIVSPHSGFKENFGVKHCILLDDLFQGNAGAF